MKVKEPEMRHWGEFQEQKVRAGTSLVVQWLRLWLSMQGTQVRSGN